MKTIRAILILAGTLPIHAQMCVTPPAGLVGWWPGNGNTSDVYGGNHGTLENGATFGTGKVGQGFSLDGINDHVMIPHNSNQNLTSYSLHAWIKITAPSVDFQTIIAKTDNTVLGAETRNFGLYVNQEGWPQGLGRRLHTSFAYAPGVFAAVQNTTMITDGLYHLVVVTFASSAGLKIYLDGVD